MKINPCRSAYCEVSGQILLSWIGLPAGREEVISTLLSLIVI